MDLYSFQMREWGLRDSPFCLLFLLSRFICLSLSISPIFFWGLGFVVSHLVFGNRESTRTMDQDGHGHDPDQEPLSTPIRPHFTVNVVTKSTSTCRLLCKVLFYLSFAAYFLLAGRERTEARMR